jgi:hypothetical protein
MLYCARVFATIWTAILFHIERETAAKEATVMKTEEKQAAANIDSVRVPLTAPQEADEPAATAAPSPKPVRPWHPSWIYAM